MLPVIVLGFTAILAFAWVFMKASPKVLSMFLKALLVGGVIVVVLFFIFSGRFYTLVPFVAVIPLIAPVFKQKKFETRGTYENDFSFSSKITLKEAYDILGLKEGASRQEIIEAHRRLIKKIHPDHGGTDYLARQLNEAKQVLLNKKWRNIKKL